MHDQVKQIFRDAGATELEIGAMDEATRAAAMEVRGIVIATSALVRPELMQAFRVHLCRVIHGDMEAAFTQYRTNE